MTRWFADPFSQDIYIEVDGMEKGGFFDWEHVLYEESKQIIIERFAEHNINVYIDNGWPVGPANGGGELLPHYDTISQDSGMMLQFYKNHFNDDRKGIFRYAVIGHNAGFCHPSELNRYDTMAIGTSPKKTYINRLAWTGRTQRLVLASAVMHEIGHSIGISRSTFEGCDNLTFAEGKTGKKQFEATWGNYQSSMNYYYIFDKKIVDYSDGSNGPPYDQNDWLNIYLPSFQEEDVIVEEPYYEFSGIKIVDQKLDDTLGSWTYDEGATKQYQKVTSADSPVKPIHCDWRVYVNSDAEGRNLRVYAKPRVPNSDWALIEEGNIDSEGEILLN
jgi:hypothetical protein